MRHIAGALFSELKLGEREAALCLVSSAVASVDTRLLVQLKLGYHVRLQMIII